MSVRGGAELESDVLSIDPSSDPRCATLVEGSKMLLKGDAAVTGESVAFRSNSDACDCDELEAVKSLVLASK